MAAVTVNSYRTNVDGSYRESLYNINIATSGDTLATAFKTVKSVTTNNPGAVTNVVPTAGSLAFTTTGAVTSLEVRVIGL